MKRFAMVMMLALSIASVDCAGTRYAAPVQLSPIGETAFYARRVAHLIDALQTAAIDAEKSGVMSKVDADKVVRVTRQSALAGVDLIEALKAGIGAPTAREQAVRIIREALTNLPDRLSENIRDIVRPYISAILTMLTVFE